MGAPGFNPGLLVAISLPCVGRGFELHESLSIARDQDGGWFLRVIMKTSKYTSTQSKIHFTDASEVSSKLEGNVPLPDFRGM